MVVHSTFTDNPFARFKQRLEAEVKRIEGGVEEPPHVEPAKFRSHRAQLFNELYGYYEQSYRKNMWTEYRKWLGKNRFKHSPQRIEEFKNSKDFRKPITVRSFCSYWFGFLKNEDLYFLLSVARDKIHRKENLNKWLFWSIKNNVV